MVDDLDCPQDDIEKMIKLIHRSKTEPIAIFFLYSAYPISTVIKSVYETAFPPLFRPKTSKDCSKKNQKFFSSIESIANVLTSRKAINEVLERI